MSSGIISKTFSKGDLNDDWKYIELCRDLFPKSQARYIDALRASLLRYSIISPWPIPEGDMPDAVHVKYTRLEHEDYFFYLGLGMGIAFSNSLDMDAIPSADIEREIRDRCLERQSERHTTEMRWIAALIDYLTSHVGEAPTRNEMSAATGASLDVIRTAIDTLKENHVLVMDTKRCIVSMDGDAAKRLLLGENE